MSNVLLRKIVSILERQRAEDEGGSLADLRVRMAERSAKLGLPADVRRERVMAGGVPAQTFVAPGSVADRVILYLHGGGYVMGSTETHAFLMQNLSRASGATVVGLDYRLAPEHPFPAAVDDACAAYRWLLERHPSSRVAVAGDSAGGGLTLALLFVLRDASAPLPAAAACLSPWTDLAATGESVRARAKNDPMVSAENLTRRAAAYLGGQDARSPLASPLHGDFGGLPPLMILVGGREILYDDAIRVAEKASRAGVSVSLIDEPELFHVWPAFAPVLPEGQSAVEKIGRFLREAMQ